MFLKVLRQISKRLHKPKLLLIVDLVHFVKLLKLLAINHSLSKRRNIFVPQLLKLSHFLVVLQLARVLNLLQLRWITRTDLVPFPGCQSSCGIISNGSGGLVVSFVIRKRLKC